MLVDKRKEKINKQQIKIKERRPKDRKNKQKSKKKKIYSPVFSSVNKSAIFKILILSTHPATAHTRGDSTNVPKSWTFLPFAFPTIKASVTVRAISTSPKRSKIIEIKNKIKMK